MVKGKFQDYLPTKGNSWTYSCLYCRAHLARHEDLISKSFQGSQGRAYLFNQVMNVECSEAKQRVLLTGIHFVADVFCACCQTMLGWKYERAFEASQRYKEGKVIIELAHLIKDNGWDTDWITPPRRSLSALSSVSLASKSAECPAFFQLPKGLDSHVVSPSLQSQSAPSDNPFVITTSLPHAELQSFTSLSSSFPSTSIQCSDVPWVSNDEPSQVSYSAHLNGSFGLDAQFCTPEEGNSPNYGEPNTAAGGPISTTETGFQSAEFNQNPNEVDTHLSGQHTLEPTASCRTSSPVPHPTNLFLQAPFGGHKRRRMRRAFFHRRASSSSPSRTSLLPLVSDGETDEEEGASLDWMRPIDRYLTPAPRLFGTFPKTKVFKDWS